MSLETALPERPSLIVEGKHVTDLFAKSLTRWRTEIGHVFNPATNEHATWPSDDIRTLFAQYANRPKLAIEMAVELSAMILDIEKSEGVMLGKKAYAHQLGQLKWLVLSLIEGGQSYLIEGAPGSGKTLVLGAIMMAATRLQVRGLMDTAVVYGTHRPFILAQQTFSSDERRMRLAEAPAISDLRHEVEYCQRILGPAAHAFINQSLWKMLRSKHYATREEAVSALCAAIAQQEGGGTFVSTNKDLLTEVSRLLTIEGVLVYDVDDSMTMLPLTLAPITGDEDVKAYGGDVGRGIPSCYIERGFVAARKGADVNGNAIVKSKDGERTSLNDARVLLTTAPSILVRTHRKSIAEVLARTGIFIVDEGRDAATRYTDVVHETSEGSAQDPLIFMASALSTTNGLGSRPHADRYSPRLTIEDAMEPNVDGIQVLGNVGVDMFPGNGSVLYPSETAEAIQQLTAAHFTDFPLPDALDLPQPYLCTSLIVVSADSVAETVRQLREEYQKRGISADVVPFRSCQHKSGDGNSKFPYSERVLQAMIDPYVESDGSKRVRIMVSTPDAIKDALSIPTLQNVTIGTAKGISETVLLRIFGRLQHSNIHRQAGPAYRGYFRQGLYQNTRAKETIFHLLDTSEGDSKRWVPLQVLKGNAGAQADQERVEGMPTIAAPLSDAYLHERREEKGKTVRQVEIHREYAEMMANTPTKEEFIRRVRQSPGWKKLDDVARRANGNIDQADIWAALNEIVPELLHQVAPAFMVDARVWPNWIRELRIVMFNARSRGARAVIDAAKERFVAGIQVGYADDEFEENDFTIADGLPDDEEEGEEEEASDQQEDADGDDEEPDDAELDSAKQDDLDEGLELLDDELDLFEEGFNDEDFDLVESDDE